MTDFNKHTYRTWCSTSS